MRSTFEKKKKYDCCVTSLFLCATTKEKEESDEIEALREAVDYGRVSYERYKGPAHPCGDYEKRLVVRGGKGLDISIHRPYVHVLRCMRRLRRK